MIDIARQDDRHQPAIGKDDGLQREQTHWLALPLQRELELDAQAGIPPAGVLKLATLGAARIMKRDSELGSIAPGKLADVVLVDGNPVANISDVRKTVVVVKNGVVYRPTRDVHRQP